MYDNIGSPYTSLKLHDERAREFELLASDARLVKETEEERRDEWILRRRLFNRK